MAQGTYEIHLKIKYVYYVGSGFAHSHQVTIYKNGSYCNHGFFSNNQTVPIECDLGVIGCFDNIPFDVTLNTPTSLNTSKVYANTSGGSGNFYYYWTVKDGNNIIGTSNGTQNYYDVPCGTNYTYYVEVEDLDLGCNLSSSKNVQGMGCIVFAPSCNAEFISNQIFGFGKGQIIGFKFSHPSYPNIPFGISFLWELQEKPLNSFAWTTIDESDLESYTYLTNGLMPVNTRMCLTIQEGNCEDTYCKGSNTWYSLFNPSVNGNNVAQGKQIKIKKLSIYPNPATSNLNIDFSLEKETPTAISIFDTTGKQVEQQQHEGIKGQNNVQLDLSKLQNGIYYVKVNSELFSKTERIVIRK